MAILIVGLISSTALLLFAVLYQNDWCFMLSIVLQVLPVLLTRDELGTRRWYAPVWLAWFGLSFLGARWLQVSEGLKASPVFDSYGPGYLIMAILAVIWPTWFSKRAIKTAKGS
jgi:hypothetical protein